MKIFNAEIYTMDADGVIENGWIELRILFPPETATRREVCSFPDSSTRTPISASSRTDSIQRATTAMNRQTRSLRRCAR